MERNSGKSAWNECEANGGLESLAAEASRRTERYQTEADLEPQKEIKDEKQIEAVKGQKSKVRALADRPTHQFDWPPSAFRKRHGKAPISNTCEKIA